VDILRPLLRLLSLPGSRSKRAAKEPKPIDLSASQREQIERTIAEFIDDSSSIYAHAHAAIARVDALPLLFDWTGFMALRLDGQIVWVPYDNEPGEIEFVREETLRNMGLFRGATLHPELHFLMPIRPSDAVDCPDCRGTGKLCFPASMKHLADRISCSCGGVGWLPQDEKP
jgi:hypothetical protein